VTGQAVEYNIADTELTRRAAAFAGKKPFGKKVLFPAPLLSKTFAGITFIVPIKANPTCLL